MNQKKKRGKIMRWLLLTPMLLLAGCTSESTVNQETEMMFYDVLEVLEGIESRLSDLEDKYIDLEYQTDTSDLRYDLDELETELDEVDSRLFDVERKLNIRH